MKEIKLMEIIKKDRRKKSYKVAIKIHKETIKLLAYLKKKYL